MEDHWDPLCLDFSCNAMKYTREKKKWNKQKRWLGKVRPSFKKPEAQITSHQTQSGHCHRAFGGWRLLPNFLLLCVEEGGPLGMVSCQLLTFKNVHSHSSEALIPFRGSEQAIHSCYNATSTPPNQKCKFPAVWHITFHQAQAYSHKTDQLSRPPWYRAQNRGVVDIARKTTRNRDKHLS